MGFLQQQISYNILQIYSTTPLQQILQNQHLFKPQVFVDKQILNIAGIQLVK